MSLFKIQWLRRFIRRNTNPVPVDRAALWKNRLAVAYMLIAWNGFGIVAYMIYNGKADWAKYYGLKSEEELKMSPAQQWTKTLGIKDAVVYRVSGVNVSRYEVHNDAEDLKKQKQTNNINT
ncbi:hypothetical protein NQ318_001024 [Aromia moschata]|uniref:Uncharacterized protein n=1 Tax=Aromia moschata TaxID=1265417 RepID=A0AAV8ZGZ5_9CUCU|nr:hypothetical protein NQ318_001024 [Aromia moschata]